MRRLFLVLMAGLASLPLQHPEPAQANPAAVQAAIGACAAQPELCALVGAGAATWVLWNNGAKLYCTYATCQPTTQSPALPREQRIGSNENVPGQVETHFVMSRQKCIDMFKRYRRSGLTTYEFERSPQPGARAAGFCKLRGPGADPMRFHDRRYDSDY